MVSSSIPWVVRVFGFIEEQLQSKMTSYDQFFTYYVEYFRNTDMTLILSA